MTVIVRLEDRWSWASVDSGRISGKVVSVFCSENSRNVSNNVSTKAYRHSATAVAGVIESLSGPSYDGIVNRRRERRVDVDDRRRRGQLRKWI